MASRLATIILINYLANHETAVYFSAWDRNQYDIPMHLIFNGYLESLHLMNSGKIRTNCQYCNLLIPFTEYYINRI